MRRIVTPVRDCKIAVVDDRYRQSLYDLVISCSVGLERSLLSAFIAGARLKLIGD
jgi:hypothetical protein